jgi:glycosyltransferase involved in cell wall biosynthesis
LPRLLVFSNDPISAYVAKGEIKPRYFNPENLFTSICLVTPGNTDVPGSQVQTVAGSAELQIVPAGRFRPLRPWSFFGYRRKVLEIAREFRPDVIRSYNPQLFGYLAVYCARKLEKPCVISVHNDYDHDARRLEVQQRHFRRAAWGYLARILFERPSLRKATAVVAVYRSAKDYVSRVTGGREAEIIYNRVFAPPTQPKSQIAIEGRLEVICVGNLHWMKGQDVLIRALALEPRAYLTLLGDGPMRGEYERLAAQLGVQARVSMPGTVPNTELFDLYSRAYIFAFARRMTELAIPIIEAASAGLPLVVAKVPHEKDGLELFGGAALQVDPTPEAFAVAFASLLADRQLYADLSRAALLQYREISGEKMERRERLLFERLLGGTADTTSTTRAPSL